MGAVDLYQTATRYLCCFTIGGAQDPRSCADCSFTAPATFATTTSCAHKPLWRSDTRRAENTLSSPLVVMLKHCGASGVPPFSNEALATRSRVAVAGGGATAGRRPPRTSWTVQIAN